MRISLRHSFWRRILLTVTLVLAVTLALGPVASTQSPIDERSGAAETAGAEPSAQLSGEWPLEVGVYYVADYPGTGDDLPNAAGNGWGVYNTLRNNGWCNFSGNDCFLWSNANAWEEDFKRNDWGGTNDYWVDQVDLVFYEGHGNPWLFTFKTPSGNCTHDDSYLTSDDARLAWGNVDMEWMALLSCSVLGDANLGGWAWAMNRLHLLMGFRTTAYDVGGFGSTFAGLVANNWSLPAAWFKACDLKQPPGVVARVMAEESYMWYETESYQYADVWDDDYYWWTHTCGCELPRAVDVSQIQTMPVFETPAMSYDEATPVWNNLTAAFDLAGEQMVMSAETPTRTVSADGRELEMDNASGLFYYIDHNQLFTDTAPALNSVALSADDAKATADAFLTSNGLMPGDAQFYEVAEDTQTSGTQLGRQAGLALSAPEVLAETITDYQVIYSRIITYTPPGLSLSTPMEFSVVGPGAKLKVYVEPTASAMQLSQDGTGSVSGAMGGWRQVQDGGLTLKAEVPILPYEDIETLFELLEPQVALADVPFQNPTSKEVLSHTLAYWEGPATTGQSELIPAYALTALYTGMIEPSPGVTQTLEVTGVTYIPSSPEYMRPYARIIANSAEGEDVAPGDGVVLTAADASQTLAALGVDDSLDFVLGSGTDYVYEWYVGSVDDANLMGTGRTVTYTVDLGGEDVHKAPVMQNIILRVVDLEPGYEGASLDSTSISVNPPLYVPQVIR